MAPMMKRFTGLLNRTKSNASPSNATSDPHFTNAPVDSPENNAPRAIRLFCESGSMSNGGEEVLHLPVIVESAESSPVAAAGAAQQIRKFLSKEYAAKPHVQYNAIMLIRILSDNPGRTFTRNFDAKFVAAVKELLRNGRDASTQQILRETLDAMEVDKSGDEGLSGLLQMWRKEKEKGASFHHSRSVRMSQGMAGPPMQPRASRGQRGRETQLPNPAELASRVEEAKNTAKILLQLVQSTPSAEFLDHDLIKEFSERCSSASVSMQAYINCNNPAPDHDTMQTLIETNEQLSLAMSRHQRAVLAARRAIGANPSPNQAAVAESNGHGVFAPPSQPRQQQQAAPQLPPVGAQSNGFFGNRQSLNNAPQAQTYQGYQSPPGPPPPQQQEIPPSNPFADPENPEPTHYGAFAQAQHQRQQPSQTFQIEPEPSYPMIGGFQRQNTADLENAYSDSDGHPSPMISRNSIAEGSPRGGAAAVSEGFVSPASTYPTHSSGASYMVSPQHGYQFEGGLSAHAAPAGPHRPGPGPWHTSDVTSSYMGRQTTAAHGLTMHGAQSDDQVQEIDGYSQVGRRDRDR